MIDDLKEKLENELVTIGTDETIKNLRKGNLEKVFITKNCPHGVREEIMDYAGETEVIEIDSTNEELGTMCKKPYGISILGFLKEK